MANPFFPETDILISLRQQLKSNQNFKAMFGIDGYKKLKQLFDPCCAILKSTVYPVRLDAVGTSVCKLVYPVIYTDESFNTHTFNDLSELLAYFQGEVTNSVVVTDGCNIIVYHAPGNEPEFTNNAFLAFNSVYGYGAGIGFELI